MSSRDIDLKELFFHELAPVPTSIFEGNGDMRITKSKAKYLSKMWRRAHYQVCIWNAASEKDLSLIHI